LKDLNRCRVYTLDFLTTEDFIKGFHLNFLIDRGRKRSGEKSPAIAALHLRYILEEG
jgi:hypothetical protein